VAAWFRWPSSFSNSVWEAFFVSIIFDRSRCQCLNFFEGSCMVRSLVFNCHPSMTGVSERNPASLNFPNGKQSSLTILSCESASRNKIWIANSIASIALFEFWLMSGTITIPSSMKSSILLPSSDGTSTSRHLAGLDGTSSGKYDGGSNIFALGEKNYKGPTVDSVKCCSLDRYIVQMLSRIRLVRGVLQK